MINIEDNPLLFFNQKLESIIGFFEKNNLPYDYFSDGERCILDCGIFRVWFDCDNIAHGISINYIHIDYLGKENLVDVLLDGQSLDSLGSALRLITFYEEKGATICKKKESIDDEVGRKWTEVTLETNIIKHLPTVSINYESQGNIISFVIDSYYSDYEYKHNINLARFIDEW